MNFCHVKIEIDLFDYKQKILSSLGTDDIEYELINQDIIRLNPPEFVNTYKDNIINGHVSNNYSIFNNLSIVLLILQLSIIYTTINNESFKHSGTISKIIKSILYLLDLLIFICTIILFVILKYYTTDG